MKRKPRSQLTTGAKWYWPIDLSWYDQTRVLLPAEEEAFNKIANRPQRLRRTYINAAVRLRLCRLVTPLSDCLDAFGASKISRTSAR
jgi:hypothetical protein